MASVIGEDPSLLSLPFDHYQRYQLTGRMISTISPEGSVAPLRILDVGGNSSSLKNFLPQHEVVLADMKGPPDFTYREGVSVLYDSYVVASGTGLPFSDNSFDVVTAHDTLEHVPAPGRAPFLGELIRVSRRFVILNGPLHQDETAWAERRLAQFMEHALAGVNPSLEEHIALGLPDRSVIEEAFAQAQAPSISIPNGNLVRWLAFMALKHYVLAFPENDRPHELLDRTYNLLASASDFGGVCYREAFAAAKNSKDAQALERMHSACIKAYEPQPSPDVAALDSLVTALADQARLVRETLLAQDAQIQHLNTSAESLRGELAERAVAIAEKDAVIAQLNSTIEEWEAASRDLAEGLHSVQSTTGYRMLTSYRNFVTNLFPRGSRRGIPYRMFARMARRMTNNKREIHR